MRSSHPVLKNLAAKSSVLPVILALTIALLGCGSSGSGGTLPVTPTISSVTANCSPASISTNQTSACTATVSGTGSFSSAIAWSLSPSSIGSVSNTGVFTPTTTGTATITAVSTQDTTKSGSTAVTVSASGQTTMVYMVGVAATSTTVSTPEEWQLASGSSTAIATALPLPSGTIFSVANGIAVSGSNVYVAGYASDNAIGYAFAS